MAAQTPKSFALTLALGETVDQYAFALVTTTGAGWDPVGWAWRARIVHASTGATMLTMSDTTNTVVVDRANYRMTLAVSSDTLAAAMMSGGRYRLVIDGYGPAGPRHRFFDGTITIDANAGAMSGSDVPAASVQSVITCVVTIPISDLLVSLDFSTLAAGAQASAALPAVFSFARASSGYAVQDGGATVLLAGAADANNVAMVGRLADGNERGVYLGASARNLLPYARDMALLSGTGTVTVGAVGPDGVASSRVATASAATGRFFQFVDTAAGLTYTSSAWLSAAAGAATSQLATGHATYTAVPCALTTAWARFDVSHGESSAINDIYLASGIDFSASGGVGPGARDDQIALAQMEARAFPTQPIPTTGAAVTRATSIGSIDASAGVDPSGRLSAEVTFYPEGARGQYADPVRLLSGASDYIELDPATGLITVSIGGATNITTRPLTWSRGDKIRVWIATGNATATVVYYSVADGLCGDLAATGTALGAWGTTGTLYLLSGGANYSASAFLPRARFYRAGTAPSWVASAWWLPDFRASAAGFRNTTGETAAQTGYYETASLAEVLVRLDGTQLDLEMYSTLAGFPGQASIAVRVPGVSGYASALATVFGAAQTVRVTVPGSGLRTAYITNGMTARATPKQGTWLRQVTAVDGFRLETVPRTAAPAKLTILYGDSITVGQGDTTTVPNYHGFAVTLRRTFGREVALCAYGRRSLRDDLISSDFTALVAYIAALAGECATAAGVTVVWCGDTNSFGDATPAWADRPTYRAAATLLWQRLRAALPSARLIGLSAFPRADGIAAAGRAPWTGTTGFADFCTDFQTAFTTAALSNAASYVGTTSGATLSGDLLHPDTAGHATIAAWLDPKLP